MKILIASQNSGKIDEIKAIFAALTPDVRGRYTFVQDLELVTVYDLNIRRNVDETGQSYAENAAIKALAFYKAARMLTLADDSGLEVDVLNGAPGLYSARFSPLPDATDADRRAYLLAQLEGKPRPWTARFHCTVAIAVPDGDPLYAVGNCPGEIIPEERGSNGFGYDPIFLLPELGKTMAELSMAQKNRLSHRARAIQASLPLLEKIYTGGHF